MSADDLPSSFDIAQLRRRAKDLRAAALGGDRLARERIRKAHPRFGRDRVGGGDLDGFTLRDAQLCIARELGFDGWAAVMAHAHRHPADRPWRRWPDRPEARFTARVIEVARLVRREAVGQDEALGALLRPPVAGPAVSLLQGAGLTWDGWLAEAGAGAEQRPEPRSIGFSPAWYGLVGGAQGIALASGTAALADEHVLLALAYLRTSVHAGALEAAGVDPDEVVHGLARHGVAVTDLRPPAAAPVVTAIGPRVYFPLDEFRAVTQALQAAHPIGTGHWGFNYDDQGRGFVQGEAGLDVESAVREAVTDPDSVRVEPPGGG